MKWIKYKVNFHVCWITSWSDTKLGNTKGLLSHHFLVGWIYLFNKVEFRGIFLQHKFQQVQKHWVWRGHLWLLPSGKIRWPNLMKWIGHKVNYLGKTKRLLSHHFLSHEFTFSTKVSFQATFRTEHFRKLKKLGLAWTPSRAYAIGKKENHQISWNGLSTR